MANSSSLHDRDLDRDFDDGVLDLPPNDRAGLKKLDDHGTAPPAPKKKPAKKSASPGTSDCTGDPPPPMATTKDRRGRRMVRAKKTTTASYTHDTPKGLWAVGTMVKYLGGSKLKNDWLKKGAVGRVFGYRPGKTGGGLYAIRFEQGSTLLSTPRVAKVAKRTQS
jgi:hypothetical protein